MSAILPNCIERPGRPVAQNYRPAGGRKHRVTDGDSWASLARGKGRPAWELIRFNYPGLPTNEQAAARQVNWYLQEYVGCTKLTPDRKNYCFSRGANPGDIWLPGRMNSSIHHNVPIKQQPQTWSCWYTSLQMVVKYWRDRGMGTGLVDPSEDPETQALYTANTGIQDREKIAKQLGFTVLYASLSNEGMWDLLRRGPVIYAGAWPGRLSGHWVVIVGISDNTLAINNPAAGMQTWDFDFFMSKYLIQTAERPLVYAP
ncbi:MAG: cysteine peptidase family C39 domain-containing protein [Planctomycetota bacterium]|nr:cysteine peptidase family C39 domain-containing protein [Planctomycetota bacterium]